MHKQVWTPLELTGQNGRGRTGCFTVKDEKSPISWNFMQKNIEQPNETCFKLWCEFLEWLTHHVNKEECKFDEKVDWRWKISRSKEYVQYRDDNTM